jgi:hypothetical protein
MKIFVVIVVIHINLHLFIELVFSLSILYLKQKSEKDIFIIRRKKTTCSMLIIIRYLE